MQNQTTFALVASGSPITIPNFLQNTSSLTITYTPNAVAGALTITVSGIIAKSGDCITLDTYSGTSATSRSIALNGVTYDSFQVVGSWTASQNLSAACSLASAGSGAAYQSSTLPVIHTA